MKDRKMTGGEAFNEGLITSQQYFRGGYHAKYLLTNDILLAANDDAYNAIQQNRTGRILGSNWSK